MRRRSTYIVLLRGRALAIARTTLHTVVLTLIVLDGRAINLNTSFEDLTDGIAGVLANPSAHDGGSPGGPLLKVRDRTVQGANTWDYTGDVSKRWQKQNRYSPTKMTGNSESGSDSRRVLAYAAFLRTLRRVKSLLEIEAMLSWWTGGSELAC